MELGTAMGEGPRCSRWAEMKGGTGMELQARMGEWLRWS